MDAIRGPSPLVVGAVLLLGIALASGCNAVFGLEDVSFDSGGGGGGRSGGDGGGATSSVTSDASSSGSGTGGGACGDTDLTNVGDFGPGWDSFWSTDATAEVVVEEGQPVLHVVAPTGGATVYNTLDGAAICAPACVTTKFSLFVSSAFFLRVTVEDDDDEGNTARAIVMEESREALPSFDIVAGGGCRLPDAFASPDRLGFDVGEGADFELDDVELHIVDCAEDAIECSTF